MPHIDAGNRMDPPMSFPCATATMPDATAAALPPLEPPGEQHGWVDQVSRIDVRIVGLKPTRAATTLGPNFGEYWGPLTHEHVLPARYTTRGGARCDRGSRAG